MKRYSSRFAYIIIRKMDERVDELSEGRTYQATLINDDGNTLIDDDLELE